MTKRLKVLLIIFAGIILFIVGANYLGHQYENQYSEYNNKTYSVTSTDGKISGTITTTVSACSETERCVKATYDLILKDSIPLNHPKTSTRDSYFDSNYYYAVNIYNIELDSKKYQWDSNLKPIGTTLPASAFEIKFWEVLHADQYPPDSFLKLTHLDIYDISDPAYVNKNIIDMIDQLAPLQSKDKVKSYDFTFE